MLHFDTALTLLRQRADLRLIAVDGLPLSGKSTFAERVEAELGASTVYLDDFVRPEHEWRGLAKAGFPFPHIRYDEFLAAVLTLASGRVARYRRYDWSSGQPGDWREIDGEGLVVVEGVSALHPQLTPLYDMRLWIESDPASTMSASLERGVGNWEVEWRTLFMPSVMLYLATDPRARADHIVAGRGIAAPTDP